MDYVYVNHVILMQKKYLLKRLKKSIIKNKILIDLLSSYITCEKNINLFDQTKNSSFDELSAILLSENNLQKFDDILKKLYRCHTVGNEIFVKINAKKFMSAWMLLSFPETIIGKSKNDIVDENKYPDDIYFISKRMIDNLYTFAKINNNESHRKFFKSFNQYSNAISYFLNRDKAEKIYHLTREYFDIYKTINLITKSDKYSNEEKNECIQVINVTKEKIMSFIKSFDPSIKEDDLKLYANINDLKDKKIEESKYKILVDDIKNKKFVFFEEVLKEIKQNIIVLCGSSKICSDIYNVLDSEFLIRNISYTPLEKDDVARYGNYLVDIINKLQAPVKVSETKLKWTSMENETNDVNEYLAKMLFFVCEEIQDIKGTIINLFTMSSMGINIFNIKK